MIVILTVLPFYLKLMNLVIVESPAKAKTINKYLGSDYKVLASYGHVRDLPSKNGSVDTEHDFKMIWEIDPGSKKHLKEITDYAIDADRIILATDPDREGEAIAWHLKCILEENKKIKDKKFERVVFNEITKKAVENGISNPRDINPELVNAYMARRALDYLVGFNISPILWTKLPGSKSAGRVQSVALRLIVDREHDIELFKPQEYWTFACTFLTQQKKELNARLYSFKGNKIEKFSFKNEQEIKNVLEQIKKESFNIASIDKKPYRRSPYAPFTTSTMQQEASKKLGFSASRTMQIAQRLYQGIDFEGDTVGLITYMRTDGTNISQDLVDRYFTGTTSRLGGIDLDIIAKETIARHHVAYPPGGEVPGSRRLPIGGEYQWRREGEPHLFDPETVFTLQHSTRAKRYDIFKRYTQKIDEQSKELMTLRGLFAFKERTPISIDEVEPISSILKRFSTGAMSYGSISQEAHETLAIAMNRIGAKSNTGEGGEDPDRYLLMANGDSKRSAIKQVASGRFGVTSDYLVNADDIQIKIAQGAKPGEGGQLPGNKVYPWIAKVRYSTPGVGLISPPALALLSKPLRANSLACAW